MNRFNRIQHCSLIISSACMFLMISESDNNKIVTLKNSLVFTNDNERQNICLRYAVYSAANNRSTKN